MTGLQRIRRYLALHTYPYAIPQTWLLWAVGVALSCWVYAKWN